MRNISRNLLTLLVALAMLAAACGGSDETDSEAASGSSSAATETNCDAPELKTDGTLTVATGEPAFPPWVSDDNPEGGEGFEAAVVYALADEMGIENVTWVRTGFDDAIAATAKDYDFNIQQYSITPERAEVVSFSNGYYRVEQAIIGMPDSAAASASSLADLKDLNLGAAIATTSLDYIEEVIDPNSDALVFDDNVAAKSAFDAGQIDGLVLDLPTAYYITAVEIPEASILGVLPRGDVAEELGMLFEKDSPLVPCVNDALAALYDNGTIDSLEDEWLNNGGSIPTLSN